MTRTIGDRVRALELELPPSLPPAANYVPFIREGALVQVSAIASIRGDGTHIVGKVGRELNLVQGYEAARVCALQLLAVMNEACGGDLDRVRQLVSLRGFVNAIETFKETHRVMDGASDLFVDVFGLQVGRHARTSIGCATLPMGFTIEADILFSIHQ